jgi:membrane protein
MRLLKHIPKAVRSAAHFLVIVVQEFLHDHGPLMAAAISFFATLSLFPILLLGVSAMGYLLGPAEAFNSVLAFFDQYAPSVVTETVRDNLINIVATRVQVLAIGAVALLWTASNVFVNMETALRIIWDAKPRPIWKSRLLALGMLLVIGAGLLLSLGFAALTLRIEGLHWSLYGYSVTDLPIVWHVLGYLAPVLIGVAMFTAIYAILPNKRVDPRAALLGGCVTGALWQAALQGFRFYLARYADYDIVYGSLGGLIILVLWIYYTMIVLLLGAEVVWHADQRLAAEKGEPATTPEDKLSTSVDIP